MAADFCVSLGCLVKNGLTVYRIKHKHPAIFMKGWDLKCLLNREGGDPIETSISLNDRIFMSGVKRELKYFLPLRP